MKHYDAIVVGAGPYGLSTAAHLRERGLNIAVFGKTAELWQSRMPKGMRLRSHWWATHLSDPRSDYSFDRFFQDSQNNKDYPQPIDSFIDYVRWFQERVVPDVDETYVSCVERDNSQFRVTLADGRQLDTDAVVIAVGLYYYAHRPTAYCDLPRRFVSHASEHNDCDSFRGRAVMVIGGGQSALEYSALLQEAGATVHNVSRRPIDWLPPDRDEDRSLLRQIRAPRSAIAPGWINWAVEHMPYLVHRLPQRVKDRFLPAYLTAAVSSWVKDRVVGKVTLHEGCSVVEMQVVGGKVKATLSDGVLLTVDHVILATGYKVDIQRLEMVHPSLRAQISTHDGSPVLNRWFESSVPNLYFVGLTSMRSFGPLFRFVAGCRVAAPRVARAIAQTKSRPVAPRTIVKNATAHVFAWSGLDEFALANLRRNLPFVLVYHRVVERLNAGNGYALPAMEISVAMLEQHLEWLARHFQIVSPEDCDRQLGKRSRPVAVLTFDDGYSDVYHHAFPLLKRKGIPAGMFVITDLVGTSNIPLHEELHALLVSASRRWRSISDGLREIQQSIVPQQSLETANDPFSATRLLLKHVPHSDVQRVVDSLKATDNIDDSVRQALRPMTWEMLGELRDAGMTIGSHSKTHPFLTNESASRVREEVAGSRSELQRRLGVNAACFAYPDGRFNSGTVQTVAAAGYKFGFSTCRHVDARFPLLTIPRRGLWEQSCVDRLGHFSAAVMSCHAAGAFDLFAKCTLPHAA